MTSRKKVREPLSDEQWIERVCYGTTSNPKKLILLYNDGYTALVKNPGASIGNSVFYDYVSPWVTKHHIDDAPTLGVDLGTKVWDCSRDEDGRLTPKRLRALVEKLGLDPEHIRERRNPTR